MRRVCRWLSGLLLAALVYNGFKEGPALLQDALTRLQLAVAIGQLAYGTTALLSLIGWWRRRPWTVTLLVAWALFTTFTAAGASIAWTDPPDVRTALAAGLVTLVITALAVWCVRRDLVEVP